MTGPDHAEIPARPRHRRRTSGERVVLSTLAALAVVFLTLAGPADTEAVTKQPTVLTLQAPTELDLGVHPQVTVRLTAGGAGVPGELVSVKIGDQVSQQATTGPKGSATITITRELSAGTYLFSASFAGDTTYRSSISGTVRFTVREAVLSVVTVPAMPNMPLVVAGHGAVVKTGPDGIAVIKVSSVGPLVLQLALPADTASERVRLDRWDDGSTELARTIRVPDTHQVTVALQLYHSVAFTFHTPTGSAVENVVVPFVDISDDAGNVTRLSGPAPYWIEANTITRLVTGFSSAVPEYRIVSVQLDGAEVVNRGQQRFTADVAKTISVELLVFDLAIQGRDALLKSPAGSKATITSTDGVKYFVGLEKSGQATIALPRGEYRIVLGNGIGIPLTTPVALSRDQGVDVLFITPLDILLVLASGMLLAFALVAIGRPHVLRLLGRQSLARVAMSLTGADAASPAASGSVNAPGATAEVPMPAVSWPDPDARLSAPERVQRPRPEPIPASALSGAEVTAPVDDRTPDTSLHEVLARRGSAQRRGATGPSTTPTAGSKAKSRVRTRSTTGASAAGAEAAKVSPPPIGPTGRPARKPGRVATTALTAKAGRVPAARAAGKPGAAATPATPGAAVAANRVRTPARAASAKAATAAAAANPAGKRVPRAAAAKPAGKAVPAAAKLTDRLARPSAIKPAGKPVPAATAIKPARNAAPAPTAKPTGKRDHAAATGSTNRQAPAPATKPPGRPAPAANPRATVARAATPGLDVRGASSKAGTHRAATVRDEAGDSMPATSMKERKSATERRAPVQVAGERPVGSGKGSIRHPASARKPVAPPSPPTDAAPRSTGRPRGTKATNATPSTASLPAPQATPIVPHVATGAPPSKAKVVPLERGQDVVASRGKPAKAEKTQKAAGVGKSRKPKSAGEKRS